VIEMSGSMLGSMPEVVQQAELHRPLQYLPTLVETPIFTV